MANDPDFAKLAKQMQDMQVVVDIAVPIVQKALGTDQRKKLWCDVFMASLKAGSDHAFAEGAAHAALRIFDETFP